MSDAPDRTPIEVQTQRGEVGLVQIIMNSFSIESRSIAPTALTPHPLNSTDSSIDQDKWLTELYQQVKESI